MPIYKKLNVDRFWSKVKKSDGCWLWMAGKNASGYGVYWSGERHVLAHRQSYELSNGPIPSGLFVCHTCDNPPCVNPSHLNLGGPQDNMSDRFERGRYKRNPPRLKDSLPVGQMVDARTKHRLYRVSVDDLCEEYGVSPETMLEILQMPDWLLPQQRPVF